MNVKYISKAILIVISICFLLELCLQGINWIKLKQISNSETETMISAYRNIQYEYQPYTMWRVKPNIQTKYFHTNSIGLRGSEIQKAKADTVYRIILLGGSAA